MADSPLNGQSQGPQVIINLVPEAPGKFRVQVGSNVSRQPGSWAQVIQVIQEGLRAAIREQLKEEAGEESGRIVIPSLQMRGNA